MRAAWMFWAIVTTAVAVGVGGTVALWDAASQYTSTIRTYTQMSVVWEPGSFEWLAPDFSAARARFVLANDSPAHATVESLNAHLLFDGEFAGTNYEPWEPIDVPVGESRTVEIRFTITAASIQPEGGTATIGLGGDAVVRFEGVERPLALNVRGTIGVVPAEAS